MKTFILGLGSWVVICLIGLSVSYSLISWGVNTGIDVGASLSSPVVPVYATEALYCIVCGNYRVSTKPVQKTQSSARLHNLSTGVEITPIEMLGSGQSSLSVQ